MGGEGGCLRLEGGASFTTKISTMIMRRQGGLDGSDDKSKRQRTEMNHSKLIGMLALAAGSAKEALLPVGVEVLNIALAPALGLYNEHQSVLEYSW